MELRLTFESSFARANPIVAVVSTHASKASPRAVVFHRFYTARKKNLGVGSADTALRLIQRGSRTGPLARKQCLTKVPR
jgi:hypothetical protein